MTALPEEPLLEARGISAGYNGQAVIHDCDLRIEGKQAVALVGRNGAGKTTLVSALSGRLPLLRGRIAFAGRPVERLPAWRRSRARIAHVPQGREIFARLTVGENLHIATLPDTTEDERRFVYDLFPVLRERSGQIAGTLSGGEQQMLAIGRAVLRRPLLMILDEPSLGLAPKIVDQLFERIQHLRRALNCSLLLVEQQARWVWEAGIIDNVYVLAEGRIQLSGPPSTVQMDAVRDSYLGKVEAKGAKR